MVYWVLLLFDIFDENFEQNPIPSDQSSYYTDHDFKTSFFTFLLMIKNDLQI